MYRSNSELPSIEYLRDIIAYSPSAGMLFWRPRTEETMFFKTSSVRSWNLRNSGKLIGFGKLANRITIDGKMFTLGRVIWALHYGEWPSRQVCFRDRNYRNYKIDNLYVKEDPKPKVKINPVFVLGKP